LKAFVKQTLNFAKLDFERSTDRADPLKTTKTDRACFKVLRRHCSLTWRRTVSPTD